MFVIITIEAIFSHPLALGFLSRDPSLIVSCHGISFRAGPSGAMGFESLMRGRQGRKLLSTTLHSYFGSAEKNPGSPG